MRERLIDYAHTTLRMLLLTVTASTVVGARQPRSHAWDGRPPLFAHENSMRRRAKNTFMPAYPEDALRRGVEGMAAALVTFDVNGEVIKVEVLASPDPSITESLVTTLKQWTFEPWRGTGGPRASQGTLRFNFSIAGGEGRVEYGSISLKCQKPGTRMPDGALRQRLEDIDMDCSK